MSITPNSEPSKDLEEGSPTPSEVIGIVINWLRHWWDVPREKSKAADWAMVVLTTAIAVAAFWSIWFVQGQLKEARRATDLSEQQWKSQLVPWLGLEDNAVSISPTLQFAWSPALAYPTIYAGPVNYVIKNFGPAPAFHEWDAIYVIPNPDGQKPAKLVDVLCQMPEGIGKGHPETSDGEIILPGVEKHVRSTTNISPAPQQTHVESVWLLVCIAYEDSWGRVHHSRFLYMSVPGPGSGSKPISPNPARSEWTYVPIKNVYLNGAQAD
jgi:hypothetical protein